MLVCDTDALLQVLLADQLKILSILSRQYKIKSVIVPEVENELFLHKKYQHEIKARLEKALSTHLLSVLDGEIIRECLANSCATIPSATVSSTMERIQQLGAEYGTFIDPGEAYSFAAAVVLEVPAMSNDGTAVSALMNQGLDLPSPVLRAFDLFALGLQIGELTQAECEDCRSKLLRYGERVPPAFQSCNFTQGINKFTVRLVDHAAMAIGEDGSMGKKHAKQLTISSVQDKPF